MLGWDRSHTLTKNTSPTGIELALYRVERIQGIRLKSFGYWAGNCTDKGCLELFSHTVKHHCLLIRNHMWFFVVINLKLKIIANKTFSFNLNFFCANIVSDQQFLSRSALWYYGWSLTLTHFLFARLINVNAIRKPSDIHRHSIDTSLSTTREDNTKAFLLVALISLYLFFPYLYTLFRTTHWCHQGKYKPCEN